jgi:hypothetical protein
MLPETLLIVSTHGDELIGLEIINDLIKKGLGNKFDFIVANPLALSRGLRMIEKDLNRIYPGNTKSPFYEERAAAKNLEIAKRYKYVIDIHEASEGINDFIIIPRKKINASCPIGMIDLPTVLLWPDPRGPIASILPSAFELEFGMKGRNRKKIVLKATEIVAGFLQPLKKKNQTKDKQKKVFYVYGKLLKNELQTPKDALESLNDFKKTSFANEEFFPLLVGQYVDIGIICYKMKRLK